MFSTRWVIFWQAMPWLCQFNTQLLMADRWVQSTSSLRGILGGQGTTGTNFFHNTLVSLVIYHMINKWVIFIHLLSILCSPECRWQKQSKRKRKTQTWLIFSNLTRKFSPNWSQYFVTPFCVIYHTRCPHQTTGFFISFIPSFLRPTKETHGWGTDTVYFILQIPL